LRSSEGVVRLHLYPHILFSGSRWRILTSTVRSSWSVSSGCPGRSISPSRSSCRRSGWSGADGYPAGVYRTDPGTDCELLVVIRMGKGFKHNKSFLCVFYVVVFAVLYVSTHKTRQTHETHLIFV
jgi:hypothetical protein